MKKRIIKCDAAGLQDLMIGTYYRHGECPDEGKCTLSVKIGKKRRMLPGRIKEDVMECVHSRESIHNYLYFFQFVPNNPDKAERLYDHCTH